MSPSNLKALRVMDCIANSLEEVKDLVETETEFYFRFRGHFFSISKVTGPEDEYWFYVYPSWQGSTSELSSEFDPWRPPESSRPDYVTFDSETLGQDSKNHFFELYSALSVKKSGVDDIFTEILEG